MGMIGVGGIAQDRHIPSYLKLSDKATLQAVSDINEERAKEVAEKFGIPKIYTDYHEMLEHVDAVTIGTPNKFHSEMTVAALEAGVHVFCEKPMAMTVEECEAMVRSYELPFYNNLGSYIHMGL